MDEKKDTDLQGVSRLLTEATIGITNLVEAMHKRVVHPPLLPSTPIQHLITKITGFTFKNVRRSTRFVGRSVDKALGHLAPVLGNIKEKDDRDTIRSVLNGVLGDYLVQHENPLQISIHVRHQGKVIKPIKNLITKSCPKVNGTILLLIHGSCMNDTHWTRKGHNHGTALAEEFDQTTLFLRYNSGQHVSTNGQQLNTLLETLIKEWPVPIEKITFIAHSMGGLVTRSALYYGQQKEQLWTTYVQKIVFLATPHHGAPLEKLGNYIDVILESIPYAKPFARLGKIRSAGVTDLRYGNLLDEDWQDDRFKMQNDQRIHVPLPDKIDCYSIAGIVGKQKSSTVSQLLGDTMVTVKSALGQHKNETKNLNFEEEHTWIAHDHTHTDLLSSNDVYIKIKEWLS